MDRLNARAEDPDLWDDPSKAQAVMRERQRLDDAISGYKTLAQELSDTVELIEMGEAEGDSEVVREAEETLQVLARKAGQKEVEALLSGEADGNDTYMEINAGAGGTEAQDWSLMLMRMYMRWAEKRGFKVEIIGEHAGEEAGIKSASPESRASTSFWPALRG